MHSHLLWLDYHWVFVFTGLDYWNGVVEWNTGMENHAQNVVIHDMHACALVVHM